MQYIKPPFFMVLYKTIIMALQFYIIMDFSNYICNDFPTFKVLKQL